MGFAEYFQPEKLPTNKKRKISEKGRKNKKNHTNHKFCQNRNAKQQLGASPRGCGGSEASKMVVKMERHSITSGSVNVVGQKAANGQ